MHIDSSGIIPRTVYGLLVNYAFKEKVNSKYEILRSLCFLFWVNIPPPPSFFCFLKGKNLMYYFLCAEGWCCGFELPGWLRCAGQWRHLLDASAVSVPCLTDGVAVKPPCKGGTGKAIPIYPWTATYQRTTDRALPNQLSQPGFMPTNQSGDTVPEFFRSSFAFFFSSLKCMILKFDVPLLKWTPKVLCPLVSFNPTVLAMK